MTDVAGRESHWDPGARNPSGAAGLFQLVLPMHDDLFWALGVSPAAWSDPYWNARAARELWDSSGVAPWGSC
jgi:membrane-bound lytic murein transglycosylase MltF